MAISISAVKTRYGFIAALMAGVFFTILQFARPAPTIADDKAGSESALRQLRENVRTFTLSNGLRVIMHRRGIAPVFAGLIAVRVGGVDETPGETGISHMLEHMAFKGTPQIGTKNYSKEAPLLDELESLAQKESNGIKLSEEEKERLSAIYDELKKVWIVGDYSVQYERRGASGMNATTSKEITNYFVNLPRSAFEFWCWAESERLLNPVMRQFYQERDVVMEERRMRSEDDPEGKLYEMMLGVAYLKHPYRNPVIGYPEDLQRLTATMTEKFHRKYYVPANMVISLVGDVIPERDLPFVERYFGRIPVGPVPPRPSIVEGDLHGERRINLEREASPVITIAYPKPNYPHPDDAPISMMGEILVGSRVSPVYTELVKKRKVASQVDYSEGPGVSYPNLMFFSITPNRPHSNEEVLNEFDKVIEKFRRRVVSDQELAIAKRSIAMDYLGHLQSNMSLARDFASSELLYSKWDASLDWYDEAMKVTVKDVERVADQYLRPNHRVIGTISNVNSSAKSSDRAGASGLSSSGES
ncbi:MAG: insulinase family protein [Deltaproteobacteria bacterium]|nr:insulinase family protein [Deltaproteobacteria bacterium]